MIARSNSLFTQVVMSCVPRILVSVMAARVGQDCSTYVSIKLTLGNLRPQEFAKYYSDMARICADRKV